MKESELKILSLIVPCFNEANVLPQFLQQVLPLADLMPSYSCEFLFVDDGSTDQTAAIIADAAALDDRIKLLSLSRNFGHQRAITAGLDWCAGEYVVVIDADLQDPPQLIPDMIAQLDAGFDVVHGVRTDRAVDSILKRNSARLFYAFMRRFVLPELPENSGDFKAFNRKVLIAVSHYPERVRFLRGALATVGFNQTALPYIRGGRRGGKTKYSLWRMLAFTRDAIFSNTIWPLRLAMPVGLLVEGALFATLLAGLLKGTPPAAEEGLLALAVFSGGAVLIFLGVLGEYIKILLFEVKQRPVYLVRHSKNLSPKRRPPVQEYNRDTLHPL